MQLNMSLVFTVQQNVAVKMSLSTLTMCFDSSILQTLAPSLYCHQKPQTPLLENYFSFLWTF